MQTLSNNSLIKQIKEANQDFEFYPTTAVIAQTIYRHLDSHSSVLDIGAGNGNFFRLIEEIDGRYKECAGDEGRYSSKMGSKYAIEKSKILIDNMDEDIALVGTDFLKQTLIDKKVNVVFSNPPYSEVEQWIIKIIKESNCKQAFVLMPVSRWNGSVAIKKSLEARKATHKCILEYDYTESEFRKARTLVGVYKINFQSEKGYSRTDEPTVDPFDLWFDETFKIDEIKDDEDYTRRREAKEKEFAERLDIVKGQNLIERLEVLYNEDLNTIQESYKSISKIPFELLKELDINKGNVKAALRMKLEGTKNLYWEELFSHLDVITKKLTSGSRKKIQEKITDATKVDFSSSNAYAVVCWVLKNANLYFDEQLLHVYKNLTSAENVSPYKSNHRFKIDDFRYCSRHEAKQKLKHYKLDYRIILESWIEKDWNGKAKWIVDGYADNALITDIKNLFVIANNLGFNIPNGINAFHGATFGEKIIVFDNDCNVFAEIRVYKKGTIHFKFCQEFMKAFNVEAGRLLGWLKSPQEAAQELDLDPAECLKYFKSNLSLERSNIKLLACETPTETPQKAPQKKESSQAKFNFK